MGKTGWVVAVAVAVALALSSGCATGPAPRPAFDEPREYRIGNEDVLEVAIYQAEGLSRTVPVRPDGKISLPLLGDVKAEGFTSSALAIELQGRLGPYLKDPRVTVIVREVNSPRVFVMGEVNHPGSFPLRGNLDVVQVLALAGGFATFADRNNLLLIRRGGEDGEVRELLDYDHLVDEETRYIPRLRAGDTLYVP